VFGIPRGYSMRVHPRSGIAWKNGVTVFNCEGVIDSDYTHETYVMLVNNSTERFTIKNGDRIAQAELVPVVSHVFTVTHDPITTTSNRIGGIGSTGV
jgi:dUTP pyrophosphatase